ncbi:hypothetical protein ARMSODRAFT_1028301 [Armillaria solidipes]|uniref:Uncharacterized protein n=1 Tax=Armillaria solidipes TaxID=1076256 RepID=A0A2H3B5R5_9AGAR|nr:hypothetical protein ARMSODRAFT_1028301 [Armillaria solidipes]
MSESKRDRMRHMSANNQTLLSSRILPRGEMSGDGTPQNTSPGQPEWSNENDDAKMSTLDDEEKSDLERQKLEVDGLVTKFPPDIDVSEIRFKQDGGIRRQTVPTSRLIIFFI